jgi:hypothetical protein
LALGGRRDREGCPLYRHALAEFGPADLPGHERLITAAFEKMEAKPILQIAVENLTSAQPEFSHKAAQRVAHELRRAGGGRAMIFRPAALRRDHFVERHRS